jgi:hypothetical protein
MTTTVRDYIPLLKDAIAGAKAAGFEKEANELEQDVGAAFTTSSEMLQEHGLAIKRFLTAAHGGLPRSVEKKLKACLNETELAATGWRKIVALLRRRDKLS